MTFSSCIHHLYLFQDHPLPLVCEWSGRHSLRIFYQDKLYEVRTNLPQQTGGHYLPPQTPGYPGGCAGVCILRDAGVTSISL